VITYATSDYNMWAREFYKIQNGVQTALPAAAGGLAGAADSAAAAGVAPGVVLGLKAVDVGPRAAVVEADVEARVFMKRQMP
jgi:hypothetical protein